MKRILSLITCVSIAISLVSTTFSAPKEEPNSLNIKTYFVAFHSQSDANVIKVTGGKVKKQYKHVPVIAAELSDHAVDALKNNRKVKYIEEDAKVQACGQVTPWGIPHVKATDVQQNGITGSGIKVGILDTGIDYTHEDLRVADGVTFVEGTTDYMDDNGHGTHVAGTIAAMNRCQ